MTDKREYVAGEPDPEAEAFDESQFDLDNGDPGVSDDDGAGAGASAAGDSDQGQAVDDPEEKLARAGGWCPKEEWRGDPARWVDAKTFNDSASPARMRERVQKFEEERAKDREEYSRRIEHIEKLSTAALKRQEKEFEDRLAQLRRERDANVIAEAQANGREAAENLRDQWDDHIAAVEKQRPELPAAPAAEPTAKPQASAQPTPPREANDWVAAHPQYKTDAEFGGAAFWAMDKISKEMADKPLAEQFAELDRRMAKRFPEYYPQPKQESRSNNGNGNGAPPANARQMDGVRVSNQKHQSYSSRLSATERNVGKMFVSRGDFPNLEAYAKDLIENA
jgi:hypothetical protein